MKKLSELFTQMCVTPSDINEHVPVLRMFASQCKVVVELGVRCGVSTIGLLMGEPEQVIGVDLFKQQTFYPDMVAHSKAKFEFVIGDSRTIEIPTCDLLFIDTLHTSEQLEAELEQHHKAVNKWIIMHDTKTFGTMGEVTGSEGLLVAVEKFMRAHQDWREMVRFNNNNGLMVLQRMSNIEPRVRKSQSMSAPN